jgi:hypothetical protein
MIVIEHSRDRDLITIRASGTLTGKDYDYAVPELEHAMKLSRRPLRVMIRLEDFRGWEIGALWRELEFDLTHRGDFGRVAVVGETGLEEWGTILSSPFAKAEMRFFPVTRTDEAESWLSDDPGRSGGRA